MTNSDRDRNFISNNITRGALSDRRSREAQRREEERDRRRRSNRISNSNRRLRETTEMRRLRLDANMMRQRIRRFNDTEDQIQQRRQIDILRHQNLRAQETEEETVQRRTQDAARHQIGRTQETEEETVQRRTQDAVRHQSGRTQETEEETVQRRTQDAVRHQSGRTQETEEQTQQRLLENRTRNLQARQNELHEQRQTRLAVESMRRTNRRLIENDNASFQQINQENVRIVAIIPQIWNKAALNYNPNVNYNEDTNVSIGKMTKICQLCNAKKWPNETVGMCCSNGKVLLDNFPQPPEFLQTLLNGDTIDSKEFLRNVRQYNGAFQMTSFGAKIVKEGGFMPSFKVQGQICHRIGSLLHPQNEEPKFLQIYFVEDFDLQAQKRLGVYSDLKPHIILELQRMLHEKNSYVNSFKFALEMNTYSDFNIVIDADKRPAGEHQRRFNSPVCNEVAVIMSETHHGNRDIVLRSRDDGLKRINETHRSYDALQYPLICVNGEDGYHFGISQTRTNKTVSCKDFYSYHFMTRENNYNMLHRFGALFQQYAVDMFAKMESERLCYIKTHQKELRVDSYIHLRDGTINDGGDLRRGQLCILPSSYTGSPRYMHEKTQDAMTYVRCFGRPDLFITFTCNPLWSEITDELSVGQTAKDRYDITSRVFQLKLKTLMKLIFKFKIFGEVQCHMYTVEWQKRGLPHSHILVWLKEKLHSSDIDRFVSAELPDPTIDPGLFQIVKTQMVHGPCGVLNPNSPCMKGGKCTKKFPRKFIRETQTDQDGYPLYRRRKATEGGFETLLTSRGNRGIIVDNRWIVPYCPILSKIFNGHINVEFCNSVNSIKYVCKYINKGSDAAMYSLNEQNRNDEVAMFQMGRYISSSEAFWRIFGFDIHNRYPSIQHLSVHLENRQRIYFTEGTLIDQLQNPKDTTLIGFFKISQQDSFAKTLLYNEMPSYYTWKNNKWSRRKRGIPVEGHPEIKFDHTMGRVYSVHPNQQECFYLRILLHQIRGPTCFEDLKTVNGILCSTYREACMKLGLLENDNQWENTMAEAVVTNTPTQLRRLFALLIKSCEVNDPLDLWLKFKNDMSEDYRHLLQVQNGGLYIDFNSTIFNMALISIENTLIEMGGERLTTYGFPPIDRSLGNQIPTEIHRELGYNIDDLVAYVAANKPMLLEDQLFAFNSVLEGVYRRGNGNQIFFLDAPGGTGKTFVINLILAELRSQSKIVLAVASSGIASTLLPGGRTAHSAFKLPLKLTDDGTVTCNINNGSGQSELLKRCSAIIWDECTMANRIALEALDRTLRDIRENNKPFGGITILLSGDFRQTLPVIPRGTRGDQIKFCLKSSPLWSIVKTVKLSTNMRVYLNNDSEADEFSTNILKIGEGRVPSDIHGNIPISTVANLVHSVEDLRNKVFPDLLLNFSNPQWLCERGILAPTNQVVNTINEQMIGLLPGEEKMYKSFDTTVDPTECVNYPIEFLNSIEMSGVPSHRLILKIGSPIMLMRNLDAPRLCNGTRLIVKRLMSYLIEATIMTGVAKGEEVYIPRIPIIPSDSTFNFRRLQFPVKLCFGMSINKSQGQTFQVAGLQLEEPCFAHGQLYVSVSRVGSRRNLYALAPNGQTKNIVYQEALV